jgi:predicted amidohydrolase YtcJ
MSRHPFASLRFLAFLALLGVGTSSAALAAEACPGGKDLVLINGKVLTVDAADRTVATVRIRGERILTVGEPVNRRERCTQIVDLGGRTVIPGLIDNHTHFVRTAQAPGPFIEGLEAADSIKALQAALAVAARKAEPGEWLAAIGGFTPGQFAERRMPTRQELSAAVPDHPVYMQIGYSTRGITNDAGRRALQAAGIVTSEAGDVATDGAGLTHVLRSTNDARMRRRFPDYMNYAVSLGLTTVVDIARIGFKAHFLEAGIHGPFTVRKFARGKRGGYLPPLRVILGSVPAAPEVPELLPPGPR